MTATTHIRWRAVLLAAASACTLYTAGGLFVGQPRQGQDKHMKTHKHTNRLADASSPYLLQHAHNPVDWYPWGPEALEKAKREGKPIFLSIGYSACHWCHVMERESFENEDIARVMNKHYVCIKVDREERPDIDDIYMTAVQIMTGSGGWPLSVWLTPDLKPFHGGTYFPPEDRWGRPGFKRILEALASAYRERPDQIQASTQQIMDALGRATAGDRPTSAGLGIGVIQAAVDVWARQFDSTWGGFGTQPKFPSPTTLALLLRHAHRTGDAKVLHMATLTLDKMAYGGMYDQIGGGFHRYSVDREWLAPHFEKMLYDNAQLASVYLDAYRITGKPLYRRIAEETLDYVLQEMADPAGGFHSTQDADSEGEEGKYYLWDMAEVKRLLPGEDGELFCRYYGVTQGGNFEHRNILHVPTPPEEFAASMHIDADAWAERLQPLRAKLLAARAGRIAPGKDDKVLTDWNGLMISAFARGYQVLGNPAYLHAAERSARFVLEKMRDEQGALLHAHRAGRSHIPAYLDDYAFLAAGLIDLYEATFDVAWIEAAKALSRDMAARFDDAERGGFYLVADGRADVIVRTKSAHDSAVPSGNGVAALALLRLAALAGNSEDADRAERTLRAFGRSAERSPTGFAQLLCAVDFLHGPSQEIAVIGNPDDPGTQAMLRAVRQRYGPNRVVAVMDPNGPDRASLAKAVPLLADRPLVDGRPAVYVCRDFACDAPVTNVAALEALLDRK